MKVNVNLTVEVDPEAWAQSYGTDPADLRNDVKSYVLTQIQNSAAVQEGGIKDVTLK